MALRTQQILAYESGVADVVDPLGGAYAIEALTAEIEARAAALIAEIDRRGGMVAAIEAGFPQREIERRALEHQRAVESGARVIVGVNRFSDGQPERPAAAPPRRRHRGSPEGARWSGCATRRDASLLRDALSRAARSRARHGQCFSGAVSVTVKARATLGEIADVFREIFGEYRPT